jgi:hypothetical protein
MTPRHLVIPAVPDGKYGHWGIRMRSPLSSDWLLSRSTLAIYMSDRRSVGNKNVSSCSPI